MQTKKLPIARANLADKRRLVIYSQDLADYSGVMLNALRKELMHSRLREGVDWVYSPKKEDFALSLASAQALLIMAMQVAENNNDGIWQTWHAITDYIQGIKS